jgi:hypothetical protein
MSASATLTEAETIAMIGGALNDLSADLEKVCLERVRSGDDIRELVILLDVIVRDGSFTADILTTARSDLAATGRRVGREDLVDIATAVERGRRDLLPVVFMFADETPVFFHLAWIDFRAVSKEALS